MGGQTLRWSPSPSWRAALLALGVALTAPAQAAPAAEPAAAPAASVAYRKGIAAVNAKDFAAAAKWFAEADRLLPSPAALTSALRASIRADDGPLAMELAERTEKRAAPKPGVRVPPEADFRAAAATARTTFAAKTGKLKLRCHPKVACKAKVGDRDMKPDVALWMGVGKHLVSVTAAGRTDEIKAEVRPGETTVVEPAPAPMPPPSAPAPPKPTATGPAASGAPAPPPPPPDESPQSDGLSPAWFGVALGTTAVLGGITLGSGFDTKAKHDAYLSGGEGLEDGQAAQVRTNMLLGVTGGLAAGTLILGLFTDWGGSSTPAMSGSLSSEGGQLELAGWF